MGGPSPSLWERRAELSPASLVPGCAWMGMLTYGINILS